MYEGITGIQRNVEGFWAGLRGKKKTKVTRQKHCAIVPLHLYAFTPLLPS
jgi:hypothetical protein